jgi:hypothetical protein
MGSLCFAVARGTCLPTTVVITGRDFFRSHSHFRLDFIRMFQRPLLHRCEEGRPISHMALLSPHSMQQRMAPACNATMSLVGAAHIRPGQASPRAKVTRSLIWLQVQISLNPHPYRCPKLQQCRCAQPTRCRPWQPTRCRPQFREIRTRSLHRRCFLSRHPKRCRLPMMYVNF